MTIKTHPCGLFVALTLTACPSDDTGGPAATETETTDPDTGSSEGSTTGAGGCMALELAGTWNEAFPGGGMQTHTITDASWEQVSEFGTSLYDIEECDNAAGTIIAQADSGNEFNPDLYSKFEWTAGDAGSFYYCQTVFDAATAQDAQDAAGADRSDPATGGCATFPWSLLDPL